MKEHVKPKKPLNGYMMFKAEMMDELKKDHPKLEYKELFGMVGERWNNLSEK